MRFMQSNSECFRESTIQPEQKMKSKNMTTLPIGKSISRSLLRRGFILIAVALACFGFWSAPNAFGVSPPPDGGYANGNTAEGSNALFSLTSGMKNTAAGYLALYHDTTGQYNAAIGAQALYTNATGVANTATGFQALFGNTTASHNTASGYRALYTNTNGGDNTADGTMALFHNTNGGDNTAVGYLTLFTNYYGSYNTAMGARALNSNFNGPDNTAMGYKALYSNISGGDNTAVGYAALYNNTTFNIGLAAGNTAVGSGALYSNTDGNNNTAVGIAALSSSDSFVNTAVGALALQSNTGGSANTAMGYLALNGNTGGSYNTAMGESALSLSTGDNNTAVGWSAGSSVTGSGNVCIGQGVVGASSVDNTTWIRNVYDSVASARPVYVNSDNKIGTLASSRRYKEDIKPMEEASEYILALKPVTFRYKQEFDPYHVPMFGLIAEDVEKVNPDLVTRDRKGEAETVRYEAINAMLLNEFLKEHKKVEDLEKELRATIVQQQKEIEALTTSMQKVSAQLELSKATPQIVVSNQ